MNKKSKIRSNLGNVYSSKRWAERWARGRPIRKVPGGWMICRKRRRKPSRRKSSHKQYRRRARKGSRRSRGLVIEF